MKKQRIAKSLVFAHMKISVCLALAFLLIACDVSPVTEIRSGNANDAYLEEPLSLTAKQYKPYLETANANMRALLKGDYQAMLSDLHHTIDGQVSAHDLQNMHDTIKERYGELKDFKPMQWWFINAEEDGKSIFFSRKIGEHERGQVIYDFVFFTDDAERKLGGFYMRDFRLN